MFIQYKYREIYEEYIQLFNVMNAKHPKRRDLATSRTFEEWKAACFPTETVQNQSSARSTSPDIINRALQEAATEVAAAIEHLPSEQNLPSPPGQDNNESIGHLPPNLNNEADDIINELVQDEAVRNMFQQSAEDEGIGLNVFDEIEFDIEPFDFDVEVESFDYLTLQNMYIISNMYIICRTCM